MPSADDFGIAFDGSVDITLPLAAAINAQPPGTTFTLHPNGLYLSNPTTSGTGDWHAPGVTVDGQGAKIFRNVRRTTYGLGNRNSGIELEADDMTVRDLSVYGFRKDVYTGNKLTTVAGSPTVVATTVLLDVQNEEVRLPQTGLDYNILHNGQWMNHETPFYFRGVDGLVRFEAMLSDSAGTPGDCVFAIIDDADGSVLASTTLTLTPTSTKYTLTMDPLIPTNELGTRMRITVRKATTSTNTITVASITAYGEAGYRSNNVPTSDPFDGGDEFSHGVEIGSVSDCTVEDVWVEGFDGDGFNILSDALRPTIRNCTARGIGRHSYTIERPTGALLESSVGREVGRSGVDFEPNLATWAHFNVALHGMTFENVRNYSIAMSQFARGFDCVISDTTSISAGMGPFYGGAVGLSISRFTHQQTTRDEADRVLNGGYAGADFICFGINVVGDDLITDIGFRLPVITRVYDPPGAQGVTTYSPDNIHLTNVRALHPTLDPPWVIDTPNSSLTLSTSGPFAVWDDPVVRWDDPDWTWDGLPFVPVADTEIDRQFRIGKVRGGSTIGGPDRIGGQVPTSLDGSFHIGGATGSSIGGPDRIGGSGSVVIPSNEVHGSVSFEGAGDLTLEGTRTVHGGALAFEGAGDLILGAGTRTVRGSCGFAGSGLLELGGARTVHGGALAFAGAGSLALAGERLVSGSVAFVGAGSLFARGTIAGHSSVDFTGSGDLSLGGTRTVHGSVAFAGAGALSVAAGHRLVHGSVNLIGEGSLSLTGGTGHHHGGQITFVGVGTLVANGRNRGVGRPVFGPTISKTKGGPSRLKVGTARTRSDLVGAHDDG